MKNHHFLSFIGLATLLATLVIFLSSAIRQEDSPSVQPERIDLALRKLGHQILRQMGDSTSTISSVYQRSEGNFVLPLGQKIDYELLRQLGPDVLAEIGLHKHYSLALLNQETDLIALGFDWLSLQNGDQPACSGRDQSGVCHDILLTLYPAPPQDKKLPTVMAGGLFLLLIGSWWWQRRKPEVVAELAPEIGGTSIKLSTATTFDPVAQQLTILGTTTELTFREAKLLQYLTEQQGEVLSRETIHAAVWGSEGVLVGRSLDVFISRLRKKLASDESVEIATIHGIGYRFLAGK